MFLKGRSACSGQAVTCVWFAVDEAFFHFDKPLFFEGFKMAGEVTVGELQQVFQFFEVHSRAGCQCSHQAEPNAAIECLVEAMQWVIHLS